MAYDEAFADRVRAAVGAHKNVREQKMFGGIAFMIDDKMAVGVHGSDLMVRVPVEEHDKAVKEPGARIMDMIARPMKGFLFIGPAGTKGASLKKWVTRSVTHVATLPPKKKPKKRPNRR
jgi:TfoX/Sxy family transcriptional regulator of competence genes